MEPIPETMRVIRQQLERGDTDLSVALRRISRAVTAVVPECVGLSLASFRDGITYTLVSTSLDVALLDAAQYVDGGPCVSAAEEARAVTSDSVDALSEEAWQLYAQVSSEQGVASSLTLPLTSGDAVVGTVNLYAATRDAFHGHEEEVARAIGTTASNAVANADLSFSTLLTARQAPQIFEDEYDIDLAVGILAQSRGIDVTLARDRLRDAARRADVTEGQAARAVRDAFLKRDGGD